MEDLIGDDFEGELDDLLFEHLPNHRAERGYPSQRRKINTRKIAYDLGISTQAVNYWFQKRRMTWKQVIPLTKLEGSTLTVDMLLPFTIRD